MTQTSEIATVRRPSKSASAFRTIGEVAEDLELPPHVLRFWESKFPQLKPLKRGGGRRYYRPEDIFLLRRIRQCLYQDGYTIRGVQKLLREGGLRAGDRPVVVSPPDQPSGTAPTLFPLDHADPPALAERPRRAKLVPPAPADDALRDALEDARRELLAVRTLLDELRSAGTPGPSEG